MACERLVAGVIGASVLAFEALAFARAAVLELRALRRSDTSVQASGVGRLGLLMSGMAKDSTAIVRGFAIATDAAFAVVVPVAVVCARACAAASGLELS